MLLSDEEILATEQAATNEYLKSLESMWDYSSIKHEKVIVNSKLKAQLKKVIDYFGVNIAYWEDKLAQYDTPKDCPEWQSLLKEIE